MIGSALKLSVLFLAILGGVVLVACRQQTCCGERAGTSQSGRPESSGKDKTPMDDKVVKSDAEWRETLSPEQYQVTRQCGTEPAFTGKYHDHKGKGTYRCQSAVPLRREVRFGHRLAELLAGGFGQGDRGADRQEPSHDADGSAVQPLRRPPGARVRRRPEADRAALLHQLGRAEVRGRGRGKPGGVKLSRRQRERHRVRRVCGAAS